MFRVVKLRLGLPRSDNLPPVGYLAWELQSCSQERRMPKKTCVTVYGLKVFLSSALGLGIGMYIGAIEGILQESDFFGLLKDRVKFLGLGFGDEGCSYNFE